MQIVHRISITATPEISKELLDLGVVVSEGFVSFEVDESQESWPALKDWIAARKAVDIVMTRFTKKEIADAKWLELVPNWHHGYPQPNEDEFGYREATFDLTEYCEQCGIGMRQKAPFQMKAEPKWGRNGILQLNWVFDEYFVTPGVWESTFRPYGIKCRPVFNAKGAELKTVLQLVISEDVDVITGDLNSETCTKCGRIKFMPTVRGEFPFLAEDSSASIVKTKQYFGSGASASHRVIVSQSLAKLIISEKIYGATLRPVKSSNVIKGSKLEIKFQCPT